MNLESGGIEPNYIKLDFKNRIKFINEKDINEDNLDLEAVLESFTQQVELEELNSFIYKLIPKNRNDIYKLNIEQSKQYIKQYPYTEQNLIDSVNRILASDFKTNFVFNKQNLEDVCRVISHTFSTIKKFDINNEKNLLERIKNIKLNEKDIFNMYIDIEMMNEKKSERTNRIRNNLRAKFYKNQNPIYFNSTGNLPMIHSLKKEEIDIKTSKSRKNKSKLHEIYALNNENSEDEEEGEGEITQKFKKVFKKIKQKCIGLMDDKNKSNEKDNQIKKINKQLLNEDNKILVTKEYFIYPENNYGLNNDKNLELPLELIILLKKFEKIKILTFQIRDTDEKSVKENIYLLLNINLLFSNFSELIIDFNDEELQKKLNNIFEMRGQILYYKNKKDLRIVQYLQDYKARTINCWEPEGDIIFMKEDNNDNDIKYKYTSFGNDYILGENPFENSDFFGNNLKKIIDDNDNSYYSIPDKIINIGYILPKEEGNNNFIKNEIIDEYDDDMSDEDSTLYKSYISNRTPSEYQRYENKSFIAPIIKNNSLINLESQQLLIKSNNHGKRKRKRTTPEMLYLFIKENISPFEMIFIYSYFLDKISKIKTLSLFFNDSYSLETEFFLKNEESKFDGFHFLFFINKIKELNEVNISFNSLDNRSFENILGIIALNENISILRINFFTPDINFNIASLLKLCSMMKLSLQNLFKEQIINYIKERDEKDLEMEYFILNHKLDFFYEKNICCLFNIIKKNINNYEEIVFRFDLPLLILSCDKYVIIIIKFIMNLLNLITYTKNKIKAFKLISPELILNGKITPSLRFLFKELNTYNNNTYESNQTLKELTLRCKLSGIPNIFNICFNKLIKISIGDLDLETFNGFLNDYKRNLNEMGNLISLKIGLNNSIISYEKIENKIKEFIDTNSKNLKEKILFSYLEIENIEQINDLRIYVQRSKIEKLVVQISSNNSYLLNSSEMELNEKNKMELKSLYFIMTTEQYKKLTKTKIINNLRKFFKKNKHKVVACKPYFPSYDL